MTGSPQNLGNVISRSNLSPRQRVERALRGGHSDRVPFTIYECLIPQCTAERQMRNRDMCILVYSVPVARTHYPNVKITSQTYTEGDKQLTRTLYETPVGDLSAISQDGSFTRWMHEHMFKSPDDYQALLFLIRDECYEPNYEAFMEAESQFGEDAIFRASIGLSPLQMLISSDYLGMEDFCVEWMQNRDEILKLYHAIRENRRKVYPIVANSPAMFANYGGNVVPEIVGPEMFDKYYAPNYNEAAEALHAKGKLIGSHFDANCRLLAGAIAATQLDYIEALTPAPDTDMTLAEARKAWPDKVLWLNFPSSVHLKSDEEVTATTLKLLDEAVTPDGLLMGITEDIPPHRWQDSCRAIMDGLDRHAQLHPERYT